MQTTLEEKSDEVELELIKNEEESSGETRAFQKAMENLYPGPLFTGWVIALLVVLILFCCVFPALYLVFGYDPVILMTLLVFPPVVAIFWLIFWVRDRDKATYSGIAKFYLLGLLVTIPVVIIETLEVQPWLPLTETNIGYTIAFYLYLSFIVAAFSEENAKFISYFCLKKHEPTITHPYTVVILMASFALGFASFENYGYILSAAKNGDVVGTLLTIISRAILSLPLHTITAILIGCHMSKHFFSDAMDCKIYWQALWQPFLLHGMFDIFALAGNLGDYYMFLYIFNVLIVAGGVWYAYLKIVEVKKMVVDQLNVNTLVTSE